MKLIDYIKEENLIIVKQHNEIKKHEKTLFDLQNLYDQIDVVEDLLSLQKDKTCNKGTNKDELKIEKLKNNQLEQKNKLDDLKNHSTVSDESPSHLSLPLVVNDTNKNNSFSSGKEQMKPNNKLSKIEYRNELLNQIEEKKRLKQIEIEKLNVNEKDAENKITQQRLDMYLEFIEEQKKGNFLAKSKTIDVQAGTQNHNFDKRFSDDQDIKNNNQNNDKKTLSSSIVREGDNLKASKPIEYDRNHFVSTVEDYFISKVDMTKDAKSKSKTTDTNIVASLNEVRKIMQNDHIEMLEKLLNFQPKQNSIGHANKSSKKYQI